MTYQEFLSGPSAQRRYWARSHVGWTRIGAAAPNDGHRALAELERLTGDQWTDFNAHDPGITLIALF